MARFGRLLRLRGTRVARRHVARYRLDAHALRLLDWIRHAGHVRLAGCHGRLLHSRILRLRRDAHRTAGMAALARVAAHRAALASPHIPARPRNRLRNRLGWTCPLLLWGIARA